jgi:multidrug resistance efflux pump
MVERVAGSGIVESASRNIGIGAFTSGIIAEVRAFPGQKVKAGEVLFRMDSREAEAGVALAEAALWVKRQLLDEMKSLPRPEDIPIAEAAVNSAMAEVQQSKQDLARAKDLIDKNAISDQEFDASQEKDLVARAQLVSAEAVLKKLKAGAWSAELKVAEAQVAEAEAAVEQVKTSLALQTVTAPIDGEVLQVSVRAGEFVSSASTTPLIVFGDTSRLHVRVEIDEVDIPRFQNAQKATAFRRGDALTLIPLKLLLIEPFVIPKQSLTGEIRERIDTRVLQVVFKVEASEKTPPLYVGQQLDVFVSTARNLDSQPK